MSTKTTKTRSEFPIDNSVDFQEMVNLLAVFSEASSRLAELEAEVNAELLQLIDEHKKEYATLQDTFTKSEAALELLCRTHPEWFAGAKSVKTPYGKVSFRSSPSLKVENEEATVKLLLAEGARSQAQRDADGQTEVFRADDFLRTSQVPNIEALEQLDDSTLAKFMIKRVIDESFKVTAAQLDFGRAVAAATTAKNN